MKKINLAIVGATGMVGRTFIKVLEERNFPIKNLYLFASKNSAGSYLTFNGQEYLVEKLDKESFNRDIDICLFSAGGDISKEYAPIAVSNGAIVVDNSSAWRMDDTVPLVVPEVNPKDIHWNRGIIANPNCSTIQAVVALSPLHKRYGIKRIIYSTYQAVSGSGYKGISDLQEGIKGGSPKFYPHPIAYNCLPHIDQFTANGYTKEEMKMINETRKILHDNNLAITATTVRIPVLNSHSESINVELSKSFTLGEISEILEHSPGLVIMDNPRDNIYPTPQIARDTDCVYVGRIRRDLSVENGLNLWVVADNLRKGAATNAVQIAELLIENI